MLSLNPGTEVSVAMPQHETWHFIRSDPDHRLDSKSRTIIRRAAMRTFRREQRLENIKKYSKGEISDAESSPMTVSDLSSPTSTTPEALSVVSRTKTPSIIYSPGELLQATPVPDDETYDPQDVILKPLSRKFQGLDPCGSFAFGSSRSWQGPFAHFCSVIAPIIQPLGINYDQNPVTVMFARSALSSPLFLETLCFYASVHLDFLLQRKLQNKTLYHKGQAIRLMKDHLNRGEGAEDSFIASAALLAASGHITGDFGADSIHRDAVRNMVELRGGLHNLGLAGSLESLVMFGDLLTTTIDESSPPIKARPLDPILLTEIQQIDPSLDIQAPFNLHQGPYLTLEELSDDLATAILSVSQLAIIQDALSSQRGITNSQVWAFNCIRTAVESHLLSMETNIVEDVVLAKDSHLRVYQACRLTLLISINCIFRDFDDGRVLRSLAYRLKTLLHEIEDMQEQIVSIKMKQMLLWIYFLGGMMTFSGNDRSWFAERVVRSMNALDSIGWKDLEDVLVKYVWPAKLRNKLCILVWQEVQRLRRETEVKPAD